MSGPVNHRGFNLDDTPSLKGKVCVITGGQAGIGKEITAQLLIHGISKVYILARSSEKFGQAVEYWQEAHKLMPDDIIQRVAFMPCDLTDITVVKKVADTLKQQIGRLDMLIENAGMASP